MKKTTSILALIFVALFLIVPQANAQWTFEAKLGPATAGGGTDGAAQAIGSSPTFGQPVQPAFGSSGSFGGSVGYGPWLLAGSFWSNAVALNNGFGNGRSANASTLAYSADRELRLNSFEFTRTLTKSRFVLFGGLALTRYNYDRADAQAYGGSSLTVSRSTSGTLAGPVVGVRIKASAGRASLKFALSEAALVGSANGSGSWTGDGRTGLAATSSSFDESGTRVAFRTSIDATLSYRVINQASIGIGGFVSAFSNVGLPPSWQSSGGSAATWSPGKGDFTVYGVTSSITYGF